MEPKQTNSRFSINWSAWLPSRGNVLFTLVVIVAMFWAQSANALPWKTAPAATVTSTGTWPYQGRLATSAGAPITNTIPMIFRLYNAPGAGATPLWEEQWTGSNSVQVSDGLFNVMLGSLTPIPQSVISGNGSLWLGITVNTDNEMIPRVQLGSVPFAVQALTVPDGSIDSTKLANNSVDQFKLADNAVTDSKLANNSVTEFKIADGSVTQAKLGANVSFIPPNESITNAKLADNAVNSAKVVDGSIQSRDLHLVSEKVIASSDLTLTSSSQVVPGTQITVSPDTAQFF
jgi:hypothetical protein